MFAALQGQWSEGMMHGRGVYTWKDQVVYEVCSEDATPIHRSAQLDQAYGNYSIFKNTQLKTFYNAVLSRLKIINTLIVYLQVMELNDKALMEFLRVIFLIRVDHKWSAHTLNTVHAPRCIGSCAVAVDGWFFVRNPNIIFPT